MEVKYRIGTLYYDGMTKYHIERSKNGGRFKLLFGNLSHKDASSYLKDPFLIEQENKRLNKSIIFLGVLVSLSLLIVLSPWFR